MHDNESPSHPLHRLTTEVGGPSGPIDHFVNLEVGWPRLTYAQLLHVQATKTRPDHVWYKISEGSPVCQLEFCKNE